MKKTPILPSDVELLLEGWRLQAWEMLEDVGVSGRKHVDRIGGPERAVSREYLDSIDHDKHHGFPEASVSYDFTDSNIARHPRRSVRQRAFEINDSLDSELMACMGFRHPALKVVYGPDMAFGWHDNRNASGLNILFTWSDPSEEPKGFWRHIPPGQTGTWTPGPDMVELPDERGWHAKMGLYGATPQDNLWHAASSNGSWRTTIGFIVKSRAMWDLIREDFGVADDPTG